VKKKLITFLVSLFFLVTLAIVLFPLLSQTNLQKVSNTIIPGPYLYEKEFSQERFNDIYSQTASYQLENPPSELDVYATFGADMKTSSLVKGRVTVINFTLISNGFQVRSIEENWVNITSISGATVTYDEKLITSNALKKGLNVLSINVNITSYMVDPNQSSPTYLYIKIVDISIKTVSVDRDNDAILDALDPVKGINNYHLLLALLIVEISVGFYLGRRL